MRTELSKQISKYEISKKIINNSFYNLLFQTIIYGTVAGNISLIVPLYALSIHANTVQVGLIAGSRGMGHFLLVVPVGILLDRFGIKKVFIISSFLSFLMILNMTKAANPSLLLLLSLMEGLTCSARQTSLNAWAFRELPYLKNSQKGWYKGICSVGSTILGPIMGTFLVEKAGFNLGFKIVAVIVLVTNLLEMFFAPKLFQKSEKDNEKESIFKSLLSMITMLKNKKLLLASYSESLNTIFTSSFRILIVLLVVNYMHKSSSTVSFITFCLGTSYLIFVFIFGFILKYLSSKIIYIMSSMIISFSLIIIAFNKNIIMICIFSILAGAGLGLLSLVNYNTISNIKEDSGKVSGVITFSTGVVMCASPMVISCIVSMFNMKIGFLALIPPFILLIAFIIFKNDLTKLLQILILVIILFEFIFNILKKLVSF